MLACYVVCDSSRVRLLGPKGSQTPHTRLTVCDDMFACWLVMLYAIEVVGGTSPRVRLIGPKGSSDTPDMSDNMYCYDM